MDSCFGSGLLKALNHGSDLGQRVRSNPPLECQKYSLGPNTGRFYELPAYSFFKELKCYLNDGLTINQKFKGLAVYGKMLIMGHNSHSEKIGIQIFYAPRAPP